MMGEHVWRYTLLGTIFSLLAFAIVAQMARIQLNPELVKYLMDAREEYQGTYRMINPARGLIYDRYGHVMAGDTKVYEVGVELAWVENPHTIALALNVVLGLDYNMVLQAASRDASANSVYVVLDNFVPQEKIDRLDSYRKEIEDTYGRTRDKDRPSLSGLTYVPHLMRIYPEKDRASNILGFVTMEARNFGLAPVQQPAAGEAKTVWVLRDPNWSRICQIFRMSRLDPDH
jgi:cell division protein FtsI/penicillin-binding protein 2